VLGWWSLFNLPREALPGVLRTFAEALVPDGQALVGTHVGDSDVARQVWWCRGNNAEEVAVARRSSVWTEIQRDRALSLVRSTKRR
jgi:hypothetical protein